MNETLRKFKHDNAAHIPELVKVMKRIDDSKYINPELLETWRSLVKLLNEPVGEPYVRILDQLAELIEDMNEMNAAEFKVSGGKCKVFIKTGPTDDDDPEDGVADNENV